MLASAIQTSARVTSHLSHRSIRALGTSIADGSVSVKSAQAFRGPRLTRQRLGPADFGRWEPPFAGADPRKARNRAPKEARWDRKELRVDPREAGPCVWDVLSSGVTRNGKKEALHALFLREKLKWDWDKLWYEVRGYGNGFIDNGMVNGAPLVTWMENEAEFVVSLLAAGLSGAQVVPLDPSTDSSTIRDVLVGSEARMLLFHQRFGNLDRIEQVTSEVVPELADPRNAMAPGASLNSKAFPRLRHLVNTGFSLDDEARIKGYYQFTAPDEDSTEIGGLPASVDLARAFVGGDFPFWSPPNEKSLTQSQAVDAAKKAAKTIDYSPRDRVVTTAPFFTTSSMIAGILAPLTASSLLTLSSRSFEADKTLQTISKSRATVLVATSQQAADIKAAFDPAKHNLNFLRLTVLTDKNDAQPIHKEKTLKF